MIDYREDMDRNWQMRLDRDRLEDARIRREHDRAERNLMAAIVGGGLVLVVLLMGLVVVAL